MRWKQLFAAACACAVFSAHIFPVSADTTASVIDPSRRGTIVVHKLMADSDTSLGEADGISGEDGGRTPMEGVEFSCLRIGELVMGRTADGESTEGKSAGGGKVSIYISLLEGSILESAAEDAKYELTPVSVQTGSGEKTAYKVEDVQRAINAVNRAGASDTISGQAGPDRIREELKASAPRVLMTGSDGSAAFSGLELGLYLIAETDASEWKRNTDDPTLQVSNLSDPFLVMLPMTNRTAQEEADGREAGTAWQYTVHCYPKNSIVRDEKWIISQDDGSSVLKAEDAESGEALSQVITSEVPAVMSAAYTSGGKSQEKYDRSYRVYRILDEMSEGLTFSEVTEVRIVPKAETITTAEEAGRGKGTLLIPQTDYQVRNTDKGDTVRKADGTELPHAFEVALTPAGIGKLNTLKEDSQISVFFTAYLNEKAKIGEDPSNYNKPHTVLAHHNQTSEWDTIPGDPVYMYTYELDMVKEGLTDPGACSFEVRRDFGQKDKVVFVKEADGIYHVAVPEDPEDKRTARVTPSVSGNAASDGTRSGKLILKGFDDRKYVFTEVSTQSGHELLSESFSVTFIADTEGVPTGALKEAHVKAGSSEGSLILHNANRGIADLTVENQGRIVLHTGGAGRTGIYLLAAVIIALCGSVLGAARVRRGKRHLWR